MAEQIFTVNCGFFDAVDSDRRYFAEDMNKPYSRVIADGVFATSAGTPSTDLQVSAAGNDMRVTVAAGQGIFAAKWFENPSAIILTVPFNNSINSRIDSVVAQVDKRTSGRVGNIVYREGTPGVNPQPPAINQTANVVEYRIANITVGSAVASISNADISDLRGSAECPWVTSLIQQVDTSTLWQQFQAGYAQQYEVFTREYQDYIAIQRQAWEDALAALTDELTVSTNILTFTSVYTATGTVSNIPINIASYTPGTDTLLVFINGLLATGKYSLNVNQTSIDLNTAIGAGNTVLFVCLHAVIGANMQSTLSMIQALDARLTYFMNDSGWVPLTLENGAAASDSDHIPSYRSIGGKIYLRGSIVNAPAISTNICTLPVEVCPEKDHIFTAAVVSGSSVAGTVAVKVTSAGQVVLLASSGSVASAAVVPLNTHFLSANPAVAIIGDDSLASADVEEF